METGLILYSWGTAFWRKYGNELLEVSDTNATPTPQIFVEYMKKQLGSLDTHLMSTVLPETMLGGWGSETFVFEDRRWEAGWLCSLGREDVERTEI